MRHFFCVVLLALPLVVAGCVKADPATDTGDGLVASSITSPSSDREDTSGRTEIGRAHV